MLLDRKIVTFVAVFQCPLRYTILWMFAEEHCLVGGVIEATGVYVRHLGEGEPRLFSMISLWFLGRSSSHITWPLSSNFWWDFQVSSRADGKVRQVKIEYKNASEFKNGKAPIRTTNRAACSVARLAKEGELSLTQELAAAARIAARLVAPSWYRRWEKKSSPILTPAGLGRVNTLFQ